MRHATILVAILTVTPLTNATAQVPIRRGERMRVTRLPICPPTYTICVGGPPLQSVGTFWAWEGDSLIMESNGNALALSLNSVTKLEVGRGQKSYTVEGAIIGLLVGGVAGALIGYASYGECESRGLLACWPGPEFAALVGGLVGGLGGGAVGALIGSSVKTDRWKEVPLSQLRVSVGPQRDGRLGLGLSVSF
ncbi:MAG: hypothetical protein IIB19_04860 [Chloroflexi bacterium]|nr:hypothetical protein [Chloroflexota bacterium]